MPFPKAQTAPALATGTSNSSWESTDSIPLPPLKSSSKPSPIPAPHPTLYQIYVGIKPEIRDDETRGGGTDAQWAVIVRAPLSDETVDQWTDCTWYYVSGNEWAETNAYRHSTTFERAMGNSTFPKRIFMEFMDEDQTWGFKKAFKQTIPQRSAYFCVRFLANLAKRGILRKASVEGIERMVGPMPDGGDGVCEEYWDSPVMKPEPKGDGDVFEMEL